MGKLHVTKETAVVFRGPRRRFFTERCAYQQAARVAMFKEQPCDCDGLGPCDLHDDPGLDARITALANKFREEDRRAGVGV